MTEDFFTRHSKYQGSHLRIGMLFISLFVAATTLLQGCSVEKLPGIYRIDIQQGNVVTQEMLARLEHGMSKEKVRRILGTPAIQDTFHQERWDYIYTFQEGGGEQVARRISLLFKNQRLHKIEGDVKPGTGGAAEAQPVREKVVTVPEQEEKGFFRRLLPENKSSIKKKTKPGVDSTDSEAGFFQRLKRKIGLGDDDSTDKSAKEATTEHKADDSAPAK